jgi:ABC-type nickel/cobalt efflux system permease component RcnA
MGNFTISHYSELAVAAGEVRVQYVLDMAEIPTVQERQRMDANGDGKVTRAESDAYLARAARTLPAGLLLRVDGVRTPLAVRGTSLAFAPGAGNLPTLKLRLRLAAPVPRRPGRLVLEYADRNYRERTGWKELVVTGGPGARLVETNAPATSLSNGLASYPADLIAAPPQQTEARAVVAISAVPSRSAQNGPASKRFASRFTELLTIRQLTWPIVLVSLLVAFALGGTHALEPGHGKTVVAAYLVGSRGTPKHALWLGLIVTFTHTAGVFLLGLVTLFASAYVVPERLYPWMGAISGLAITVVGLSLLGRSGVQAFRPGTREAGDGGRGGHSEAHFEHEHGHWHEHEHEHEHEHGHSHGHAQPHSHPHGGGHHHHDYEAVLEGGGVRLGTLVALGVSGGIVPCPGALVVLLSAIALHRVGFGLALITAFSMGLAAVLTGIGLLMVSARGLLDRVPGLSDGHWSSRLAMVSASVVSLLGIGLTLQSLGLVG